MFHRVLAGPGDPCSIIWDDEKSQWVQFDESCGAIMQFTGLTDKNGKEIYEGDILRVEGWSIGTVSYHKATFRVTCEESRITLEDTSQIYLEVIGNVYENRELLPAEEEQEGK
jgi:hypothetical protein